MRRYTRLTAPVQTGAAVTFLALKRFRRTASPKWRNRHRRRTPLQPHSHTTDNRHWSIGCDSPSHAMPNLWTAPQSYLQPQADHCIYRAMPLALGLSSLAKGGQDQAPLFCHREASGAGSRWHRPQCSNLGWRFAHRLPHHRASVVVEPLIMRQPQLRSSRRPSFYDMQCQN